METSHVATEHGRVLVRRFGDGAGARILYWHGGGGASTEVAALAPGLAAAGHTVYAPDAPGYGGSPPVELDGYRPAALAALAAAVLDRLNAAPVVWIGSSWGGNIGVHTAARFPAHVSALALLDGAYIEPADDSERVPSLAERTADFRARAEAGRDWDATPETVAAAMHAAVADPSSARLPDVAAAGIPVLLVRATEPPEYEAVRRRGLERLRAAVPGAEIVDLPGATHALLEDDAPAVRRILLDWLARLG